MSHFRPGDRVRHRTTKRRGVVLDVHGPRLDWRPDGDDFWNARVLGVPAERFDRDAITGLHVALFVLGVLIALALFIVVGAQR